MLNLDFISPDGLQPSATVQFEGAAGALRRRHLLAVLLMAVLVLTSFALLYRVLDRQAPVNAYIIHVVGRQRLLSQRLCEAALVVVTEEKGHDSRGSAAAIQTALRDWQQSHELLLRSPLLQTAQRAGLLGTHLRQLEPEYLAMVTAAQHLLRVLSSAAPKDELWPDVDQLLAHEGPYLTTMEQIVQFFAQESSARDEQVRRLGDWLRAAILLTILIEALLVVRPALRYLEQSVRKTGQAWDQVYRRKRDVTKLLSALPDLIVRYKADGTYISTHAGHDAAAEHLAELLRGRGLQSLMSLSLAAEYSQCFSRAISDGGVQTFQCPVREGGEDHHIELRLFAFHSDEVVVLMRDVTAQRQVERQVLKAVDREQQRIGRDLHDGVCQTLSGLNLVLQSSLHKVRRGGLVSEPEVAMSVRFIEQSVADIRQIARGLVPTELDALGLEVGLRRMIESLAALHAVAYTCDVALAGYAPTADVSLQIYRIAQEAVSNSLRHAQPSRVSVTLTLKQRAVRGLLQRELALEIWDDGRGLPAEVSSTQVGGLGLRTMAYRAQCIGALLRVESDPAGGTIVRCQLPLSAVLAVQASSSAEGGESGSRGKKPEGGVPLLPGPSLPADAQP